MSCGRCIDYITEGGIDLQLAILCVCFVWIMLYWQPHVGFLQRSWSAQMFVAKSCWADRVPCRTPCLQLLICHRPLPSHQDFVGLLVVIEAAGIIWNQGLFWVFSSSPSPLTSYFMHLWRQFQLMILYNLYVNCTLDMYNWSPSLSVKIHLVYFWLKVVSLCVPMKI